MKELTDDELREYRKVCGSNSSLGTDLVSRTRDSTDIDIDQAD